LKNIQELIGQNYARLRFGIGNDFPRGRQVDYVLSEFSDEEKILLPQRIETAVDIIRSFCLSGVDVTMNQYNNR
jgi:PTH1 family peptidyl-tRNA hydrolase